MITKDKIQSIILSVFFAILGFLPFIAIAIENNVLFTLSIFFQLIAIAVTLYILDK